MGTVSSNFLPNSTGLDLGSPSQRWDAFLQSLDVSSAVTLTSLLSAKNFEGIRFADQFSGATVTAQIDAALANTATLLVVVPVTMGAGNATSIATGKAILDLRGGAPKFFTNQSASTPAWQLNDDGTVTGVGWKSATPNPASAGQVRLASADTIKFRNNANSADISGLALDSSNVVQVGDTAGAKTAGPLAVGGAVTGVTTLTASGQITSNVATGTAPLVVASTTVVPNLNIANLNGVIISGSPSAGALLTATSSSAASWSGAAATYKLENIQYTPVTFVSSAGGALFTYSFPANELAVGQALRITSTGTWANTSVTIRTYTFTLKAGATTLYTWSITASNASVSSNPWGMTFLAICTASGSGGTLEVQQIDGNRYNGMTNPTALSPTANTATVAFDTTTIQSLTLNVVQTNDATTSTTGRQWMVERLG